MDRIQVHKHLIATVSSHEGGVSNTQFLKENLSVELYHATPDHTLWGQVHEYIQLRNRTDFEDTKDGELMLFDSWTLHRAMPAKIRGWRLFFRMSMWHKPNLGNGGMITKQEQVYKLIEGGGW